MQGKINKWVKIGSKYGTFLSRYNSVYEAINKYMKVVSGIKTLLDNYKYIRHTHYGSRFYPDELMNLHRRIKRKMGGVEGYIKLRKKEYRDYLKKMKAISIKVKDTISNRDLINYFLRAYDLYGRANSFLGLGTLYTDYLTRELKKKYGDDLLKFNFGSKTRIGRYHQALVRLSSIKNKMKREQLIKKILQQYYWLGSFFFVGNELSEKQILNDTKNIKKRGSRLKAKPLPRDPLVQEMKKLSQDRNTELEEFMVGEYYFRKLLYEIAKRTGMSFETLTYLSPNEIVTCLKGKSTPYIKIRKRQQLFGFLIRNGKVSEYEGQAARFLIEQQDNGSSYLSGMTAFRSTKRVRGIVKVIFNTADIKKVKKGDILVTIMTTPNYLQAIYNASAIVTDEGGITSHAAIISRELKIPCVIGTKIATQVLKDGDRVEVDANKGIVRKIVK